ncbi:MAG: T9SS type A sorting domain-containing protein [Bacteroidales bacterium]|nr:T9SS type A sorting domain-containing protein [Bacteroidales bacterium]
MIRKILVAIIFLAICPLVVLAQHSGGAKPNPAATIVGTLPATLDNTSSLFFWQDRLWTLNDHGGLVFYELDTLTAAVVRQLPTLDTLPPFSDMEEATQDDNYFYFGDFGNNHEQLRDDLRILRLAKSDLLSGIFHFDTIFFTYLDYDPTQPGRDDLPITDYDCEAMIATADSLYLFTKQWTSQQTTCYVLPNLPGRYTALPRGTAEVYGLVTGACYRPSQQLLVFSCYSVLCQPFVYVLYGFSGTDFFGGEHLRLPLSNFIGTQIEAVATADGLHYYLTNEHFSRMSITQPAQLLSLDLTDYLGQYLRPDTSHVGITTPLRSDIKEFAVSPNPASDRLEVMRLRAGTDARLSFFDAAGRMLLEHPFPPHADTCTVDISSLSAGTYLLLVTTDGTTESHTVLVR